MHSILSLWLPILLSSVIVFIVSSIIHMVLPYHRNDYGKLPSEDEVGDALRKFNIPPGDYMMPCAGNPETMKNPAFMEKLKKGPVFIATFMKPGPFNMGANLTQWFIYLLVVGVFTAYITRHALHPGAPYLHVFRFAGATSFMCYAVGLWQDSIWYKKSWSTTIKNSIDGLIYGFMTAGTFGWLWPK